MNKKTEKSLRHLFFFNYRSVEILKQFYGFLSWIIFIINLLQYHLIFYLSHRFLKYNMLLTENLKKNFHQFYYQN